MNSPAPFYTHAQTWWCKHVLQRGHAEEAWPVVRGLHQADRQWMLVPVEELSLLVQARACARVPVSGAHRWDATIPASSPEARVRVSDQRKKISEWGADLNIFLNQQGLFLIYNLIKNLLLFIPMQIFCVTGQMRRYEHLNKKKKKKKRVQKLRINALCAYKILSLKDQKDTPKV